MPVLPSSPSDFTATLKSAAIANAVVAGVSFRPSKNSGGYISLGALGAIVTQSAVAQATISQRFDADLAPAAPAPAPIIQTITLNRTGTTEVFIVKYNTDGSIQWARRINGLIDTLNPSNGQAIITDTTGNVYVCGISNAGIVVFDIDNSTTKFSLGSASTGGNTFIVKYSSDGTPQWARRIGGVSKTVQPNGIGVDSSGNVYVGGSTSSTSVSVFAANDIDASLSVSTTGSFDGFIAKYNSSGTPQWISKIGGADLDHGMNIAVDSSGNVFICGYSQGGSIDLFDSGGTSRITLTDGSARKGYIAKYNTSGTPAWGRILNGLIVIANAVTTDSSGNAYVTGSMTSGVTAPGSTPLSLTGNGAFLVKYDTNGEPLWARALNGTNTNMSFGLSTDSSSNVYLTGTYAGTLDIRNANNTIFVSTSGPGTEWDVGVVKYNSGGTPQWFRRMGSSGDDRGLGISSDSSGNIYVTGYYSNTFTIFNGSADGTTTGTTAFTTLASSGGEDAFLVKYNTTGTPLWATRISGTAADRGASIVTDSTGNIYTTGKYTSDTLTLRTTGF